VPYDILLGAIFLNISAITLILCDLNFNFPAQYISY
jgi:hypothetical protein